MILERELTKIEIKNLIQAKYPLIVEVGAYDGKDGAQLAAMFDVCEVHCIECDPRSIDLFRRCNPNNPKLKLHEVAISDTIGQLRLYQSDSATRKHYPGQTSWSASSSLKKPKEHITLFNDVYFDKIIEVECVTFQQWYDWHLRPRVIDFVWADVNGAEFDLIQGGHKTLNEKVKYMYIEFSNRELYVGQKKKEDLLSLLPNFVEIGTYNFLGNFGNVLLKNILL